VALDVVGIPASGGGPALPSNSGTTTGASKNASVSGPESPGTVASKPASLPPLEELPDPELDDALDPELDEELDPELVPLPELLPLLELLADPPPSCAPSTVGPGVIVELHPTPTSATSATTNEASPFIASS
jgi:hypothetical protein